MFEIFADSVQTIVSKSGFLNLTGGQALMILVSFVLMYLAIRKGFEPLLLLPIAFGMLLTNLPMAGMYHPEIFINDTGHIAWEMLANGGGLLDYLYLGVKLGIYPPLIFLGVGCMTDFGPLIANPKSFLMGAAAQLGIFLAFFGALALGFTPAEAGSIGIIGGADGPTAIFTTTQLAPHLLGSVAIAAYSYMALVPIIQPPIMKLLTTKKARAVRMEQLRPVSKLEKIVFPILVAILVSFLVPDTAPLIGMLMLGNLFRESGVVDRLNKTAQNELMNIVTIFLGVTVGATASAERFLTPQTLGIIVLGLIAFAFGTAGGVLLGDLMYVLSGGKINPLIGSAGVSAVPMAARVSQKVGQKENPTNFLLMHAMGPNVAGVIGSAVAAGVLLSILK
ncbi:MULTISPECIES: sodium ion-translocating decarboxylase subunit beta [Anaerotruncus]|uniref:Sodium ion-translocating decarboxylase subunit beta n=2 Tax=Anaerotruncus TaxID=244127 RepID=A0A498CUI9_9FIRM|nr:MULTISPECIES: sodium ion-translocating decarboxylase subunit beta [Anaerotruncus]MBC3938935.1 sodium ion-translocating decarboxylase subunit beta [Anaerotruncus massiliensis (ex Togo et al. 2019)]RLL10637.1 sodium ion-translocating decarboxylase subunit beta [Anaerotruncus massiliensis (ex Liu et al. 2021)]GKH47929.1 glutaconyl-CoA decarboxylase subunit beta [Oscillospiraceae bacterium]